MLSAQVIQTSIDELKNITKTELVITDFEGVLVAKCTNEIEIDVNQICSFVNSTADSQVVAGYHYLKVFDDGETAYVVICIDKNDEYTFALLVSL